MTPSRYLESYAGQKLVMVHYADLEEWDAAIRAAYAKVSQCRQNNTEVLAILEPLIKETP